MEHLFNQFCDYIIGQLNNSEHLIISFGGETSQFIRLNDAKVRQTGIINDASLSLNLIDNNRSCRGSFTFQKSFSENCIVGKEELSRLREEISQLPEDPFIVLPENKGSSREINESNSLPFEEAVKWSLADTLMTFARSVAMAVVVVPIRKEKGDHKGPWSP